MSHMPATDQPGGSAVPDTREVNTTAPLTGGGDLSANRTIELAASGVAAGSYTNTSITVDAHGLVTAASDGVGGGTVEVDGVTITGDGSSGSPLTAVGAAPSGNAVLSSLRWSPPISPVLAGAQTDDWTPAGLATASLLRTTTPTAGHVITGLAAQPDGSIKHIENHGDGFGVYGTCPLTFKYRSTASALANRFITPGLVDLTVPYTGGATWIWDVGSGGWLCLGTWTANDGIFPKLQAQELSLYPAITPAALAAGTTNDYNPTGADTTARWRVSAHASGSTLTGIVPPAGTSTTGTSRGNAWGVLRLLSNVGSGVLTLKFDSLLSTAGNRFDLPGGKDLNIPSLGSVIVVYDETTSKWRPLTGSGVFPRVHADSIALPTKVTTVLAAGNNNDFTTANWAFTLRHRLVPDAGGSTITGMVAGDDGEVKILICYGAITFAHQNAGSVAANRFYLKGAANLAATTGSQLVCTYDSLLPGWFVTGP